MKRKFETDYGTVKVRNIMVDIDGTNLEEGIEIIGDGISIELVGDFNVDNMTSDDVEELIENE